MGFNNYIKEWGKNNYGFLMGAAVMGTLWLLSSLGVF